MCKNVTYVCFALVLALVGQALADYNFIGTAGDKSWDTPTNWDPAGPPNSTDIVNINNDLIMGSGVTKTVAGVNLATTAVTKTVDINNGGSLTSTGNVISGWGAGSSTTFNIGGQSGSLSSVKAESSSFNVGYNGVSTTNVSQHGSVTSKYMGIGGGAAPTTGKLGTLNINGGIITTLGTLAYGNLTVGHTSPGVLNVNNGSAVAVGGSLVVGNYATGTFNMNGGSLTAVANLYLSLFNGEGKLIMGGGSISCPGNLYMSYGADGSPGVATLTIDGGSFTAAGNVFCSFATGPGTLTMNNGSFTAGSLYVSWAAGAGTLNVNGGSVNITAGSLSLGKGAGTATVNMAGGAISTAGSLVVSNGGSGDSTVNMTGGSISVAGSLALGSVGTGTLNLSGGTIRAAGLGVNPTGLINISGVGKIILTGDQRVAVNGYITSNQIKALGGSRSVEVWYDSSMNTTTVSAEVDNLFQAWNPTPGNHGAIVGLDRNDPTKRILWSSGNEALWHEVYFGENFTDVNSANNTLPIGGIYKGRITANSFNPSLALGHVYYWRVDEVKADGTTIMRGRVWQFTVADNLLIDDFESYADSSALQAVWTSVASLEPNVAIDQNSLKFTGPAMVSRNTPFADWTTAGVESLSIAVHGSELNLGNSNQLYVKIEDGTASSTIYYDGQNDDLIRGSWYSFQSWNIDLKMFAGVNLTHVTKITIGALSTDLIYVDDIRLHVPRCVSDKMVDINGDCSVDLKDMSLLAANWLKTSSVVNAVDPGTAGLILWYKFNETSGFTAADSSPSPGGKTGIVGGVGDGIWDTSGHNGGCLLFDGTYGLNVPASVFSVIGNQITIGVWVNGNAAAQPVNGALFHGNRNSSLLFYSMCPSGGGEIYFDSGYTFGMTPDTFDSTSYLAKTSAEFEGVWNHYAFVKDVSSGLQRIYCNGVLKAETLGTTAPLSGGLTAFTIGANIPGLNSYAYQGKLDDFKIYNRALSQAEIISLAGQSSVLQPLLTSADTNHDNNVNFNDFAKIAEHWLASNWPN